MNYQEFKRLMVPELTRRFAVIGFSKSRSSIPMYVRYPHSDKRLFWLVTINFSRRGNPFFDVLVGPYWCSELSLSVGIPFPGSVSYNQRLGLDAVGSGAGHVWTTGDKEMALQAIESVIVTVNSVALPWFAKFDSPMNFFEHIKSPIIADDLGMYDLAYPLYLSRLEELFRRSLTLPTKSDRKYWQLAFDQVLHRMRSIALLTKTPVVVERHIFEAERRALIAERQEFSQRLTQLPRSSWVRKSLKHCDRRLEELQSILK